MRPVVIPCSLAIEAGVRSRSMVELKANLELPIHPDVLTSRRESNAWRLGI
jgi:hypothetical protein